MTATRTRSTARLPITPGAEVHQQPPSRPFLFGGLIITAVLGLLTGMAYSNSLFFPLPFATLLVWGLGGAILGAAVGGGAGFAIDGMRRRPA